MALDLAMRIQRRAAAPAWNEGVVTEIARQLPANARLGDNENAFLGGFRLWDPRAAARIP